MYHYMKLPILGYKISQPCVQRDIHMPTYASLYACMMKTKWGL